MNRETRKTEFMIIVDQIKYWSPLKGPIDPGEVVEYVIGLKRKFRIGLLTYDAFQSQESILKFRKAGIAQKETKYTGIYKTKIYRELENLVNANRILILHHHLLRNEMIELQRKFTPTGFKILPKKEGDGVKSDDCVDCIAGACYIAIEKQISKLPNSLLVECGNVGGNNTVWRNMQGGIIGVGSGTQVARNLENRSRLWKNIHQNR